MTFAEFQTKRTGVPAPQTGGVAMLTELRKVGEEVDSEGTNEYIKRVGERYAAAPSEFKENVMGAAKKTIDAPNMFSGGAEFAKGVFRTTGDMAGTILAPITEGVKTGVERIGETEWGKRVGEELDLGGTIQRSGEKLADVLDKVPGYSQFILDNPQIEKDLERALNIWFVSKLGKFEPSTMVERTRQQLEPISHISQKLQDTTVAAKTKITGAKDWVMGKTKVRSPEEIIKTSPENVWKLPPSERDIYFSHQEEQALKAHSAKKLKLAEKYNTEAKRQTAEYRQERFDIDESYRRQAARVQNLRDELVSGVDKEFQVRTEASLKEINDLKQQMAVGGRDKALELRPKAQEVLRKNSAEYQRLYSQDVKPHLDVKIQNSQIAEAVDASFPNNPLEAVRVKQMLGVEKATGQSTVASLLQKMKDLRQQVGQPARSGTRTFTAAEFNLDRTANTLSQVLADNGVELSRANEFWRQWAPLRNDIVKSIKPFNIQGTDTAYFSNLLEKAAKGDIDTANLVKNLENALGEKFTTEARVAMAKMTAIEKRMLADKIATEARKAGFETAAKAEVKELAGLKRGEIFDLGAEKSTEQLSLRTQRAMETSLLDEGYAGSQALLSDFRNEAARQAAFRDWMRNYFRKGLGAILGVKVFEKATGVNIPVI